MATTKKTDTETQNKLTVPQQQAIELMTPVQYEVPTVGSYDEYYQQQVDKGLASVDEQAEALREQNEQRAQVYGQQVDAAAQQETAVYEQSIQDTYGAERQQYDANYIDELVARKNVDRALENMGLSRSGLGQSQHVQLSVMRGNADAATRAATTKRVQALQDAIAQVAVSAAQKKTAKQQELDDELNTFRRTATLDVQGTAAETAAGMVAADQENAREIIKLNSENANTAAKFNADAVSKNNTALLDAADLQRKINQDDIDNQLESYKLLLEEAKAANTATTTAVKTQQSNRQKYVEQMMDNGMTESAAWIYAYARYPLVAGEYSEDNAEAAQNQNAYYNLLRQAMSSGYSENEAKVYVGAGGGDDGEMAVKDNASIAAFNLVSNLDFEVSGKFYDLGSTFWRSADGGDGELIAEKVESTLNSSETYKKMSTQEKRYAISMAIVKGVEQSFPNESQESNLQRIATACNNIEGADYDIAKAYYSAAEGEEETTKKQKVNKSSNNGEKYFPNVPTFGFGS